LCGRTTLTLDIPFVTEKLSIKDWENANLYSPSYNIAPTQKVPILLDNGYRHVKTMRWGLIPSWAKEIPQGSQMINARAETVMEKPSFRNLVPGNRCVVLTDGFYEWKQRDSSKIPYYIHHPSGDVLPMAGLWNTWRTTVGDELLSFTIITTRPKEELAFIHNRMPVILENSTLDIWLQTNQYNPEEAVTLLKPYPGELDAYRVSQFVNYATNNSPQCIQPI